MVTRTLINPKGITPRTVIDVPAQWSAEWFRRFISTQFSNADVRNAIAGTGIVITGSAVKPAELSVSNDVQSLFHQPYILATPPSSISSVFDNFRLASSQAGVTTVADGGAEGNIVFGVVNNGIGNTQIRQGVATSVIGNPSAIVGNVADIAAAADNTVLQRVGGALSFATVPTAAIAPIANNTVIGNNSGGVASPSALTQAQLTALVNQFTSLLPGSVPASAGGSVNFLRADGVWVQIDLGSNVTGNLPLSHLATQANNTVVGNVSGGPATPSALTSTQLTALINSFSATLSGAVPASGGGTVNFLRADGTFSAPAYPTPANPSGLIGLTAANGAAATFARSDATHALDQSIAPTWTGVHAFGAQVKINAFVTGNAVNGFVVTNSANTRNTFSVSDASVVNVGNSTDNGAVNFLGTGLATFNGDNKVVGKSGFNNTAPISKPTVTGSKGANAALTSLLTALASYGLVTDSST